MSDPDVAADFRSPLDKWLWANRKTARWLAEQLDVHEATISRVRTGDQSQASDGLLTEIKRLTGLRRL